MLLVVNNIVPIVKITVDTMSITLPIFLFFPQIKAETQYKGKIGKAYLCKFWGSE